MIWKSAMAAISGGLLAIGLSSHGVAASPNGGLSRYQRSNCGSIIDQRSGLQWYIGPDRTITWSDAQQWVRKLNSCGGGWSVPTLGQLKALFDPQVYAGVGYYADGKRWPAHIDPMFSGVGEGSWVWANEHTETPFKAPPNFKPAFNFNQGTNVALAAGNDKFTVRVFAVKPQETAPPSAVRTAVDPKAGPAEASGAAGKALICGSSVTAKIDEAGTAEAYRSFLGVWTGEWSRGRICSGLIVKKVDAHGDAFVDYLYRPAGQNATNLNTQSIAGHVESNQTLTFNDKEGSRLTFTLRPEKDMAANFVNVGGTRLETVFQQALRSNPLSATGEKPTVPMSTEAPKADRLPLKEGRYISANVPCDNAPMSAQGLINAGIPIYSPQHGECRFAITKESATTYRVSATCTENNPPTLVYTIISPTEYAIGTDRKRWCSGLAETRSVAAPTPTPPPAVAGGKFGAIAFDANAQRYGTEDGRSTLEDAINAASKACGTPGCKPVLTFSGDKCGALATGQYGSVAFTAVGTSADDAARNALAKCLAQKLANCEVHSTPCNPVDNGPTTIPLGIFNYSGGTKAASLILLGSDETTHARIWGVAAGNNVCLVRGPRATYTIVTLPSADTTTLTNDSETRKLLETSMNVHKARCPDANRSVAAVVNPPAPDSIFLIVDSFTGWDQPMGPKFEVVLSYLFKGQYNTGEPNIKYGNIMAEQHRQILKNRAEENSKRAFNEQAARLRTKFAEAAGGPLQNVPKDDLWANPFAYKGKLVHYYISFIKMQTATEGVFGSGRAIVVKDIPEGTLQNPDMVIIAGKVLGNTRLGDAAASVQVPLLSYANIYVCITNSCEEYMGRQ